MEIKETDIKSGTKIYIEQDNRIVASIYVQDMGGNIDGLEPTAKLNNLKVKKNYRGRGYAKELLNRVIERYGDKFTLILYACPIIENVEDIGLSEGRQKLFKLYGHYGFERKQGTKSRMTRQRTHIRI